MYITSFSYIARQHWFETVDTAWRVSERVIHHWVATLVTPGENRGNCKGCLNFDENYKRIFV
jgi:hypothetical protein